MFVTFRTILGYRKARKYRRDYVGYLFQDYALIPDQTVYDNINLAARPNQIFPSKAMLTQVAQALDQVGLAGYECRQVCELSGGEQQRVAIARLLVRPPKVVLADEPTGALDHDNSLRVIAHLRDFADGDASVVVATHSDLVAGSADQHIRSHRRYDYCRDEDGTGCWPCPCCPCWPCAPAEFGTAAAGSPADTASLVDAGFSGKLMSLFFPS